MFDCANVEIRELLPDLVAGTVDAVTRARVEEHVASCAECASELETLRLVRSAYAGAPAVDVGRIVAALPPSPSGPRVPLRGAPVKRWMDWRIAAALTTITIGGLSLAVSQRLSTGADAPQDSVAVVQSVQQSTTSSAAAQSAPASVRRPGDSGQARAVSHPTSASRTKAQLSFGGGVSDLDDATIQQLLGALDEMERAPLAPSAEPDRSPVLPVIKGTDQ